MKRLFAALWITLACLMPAWAQADRPNLPWVDISGWADHQVVVAQGTETLYNGHPTTVLLADGKTMLCVWSEGHGGYARFIGRSEDGGKTWTSTRTPEGWAQLKNCPSIYRLADKKGKERLFVFAQDPLMGMTYSEDEGRTWSAVQSLGKPCIMAFSSIVRLKNGNYLGLYHRGANDEDKAPLTLWQSVSEDGGLTWGPSTKVGEKEGLSPCEPCVFRSPYGTRLVCIARENTRKGHSLLMYSDDEGRSWSELQPTQWGLTGDRHALRFLPDGRILVVFRDQAPGSPTKGHFVGWVGKYDDISQGLSGQYRVKLLHSFNSWDCGYPGLELLPDGTIVATTYIKYHPGKEKNSVVAVRFKMEELDALF